MKIYIDFDGTIYDTDKLNQEFINIFTKYNIKKDYIETLINKIKNYDIISNKLIKDYNLNQNIIKEVNNLYSNNLIYKDAIKFLEQNYQKHNLILLTYAASKKYQQRKINSSNIFKYFKEIIITTKDKSKLDKIDYHNGIFIDNNPYELEKFYNSNATKLIRIKRDNDKYSKMNLNIKNIPEFKDFNELLNNNYIEKIGDDIHE